MISIVILGSGNVARHLFDTLFPIDGVQLRQVVARSVDRLSYFSDRTAVSTDFKAILDADLYLIAVSDDAIPAVAATLESKKGLVAHTSGSMPLQILGNRARKGVFYPLQTFSAGKKVDFKSVPLCLEAGTEEDLAFLRQLATSLSDVVMDVSSDQRRSLHVAAVFVNNFTNYLFGIGQDICEAHHLPFSLLLPLIRETVQKLDTLSPTEAQTGPARRNDQKTIENHLEHLKTKNYRDIYALLSKSIHKKYEHEL